MVNKHRPRKVKAPYRRYGPVKHTESVYPEEEEADEGDDMDEMDGVNSSIQPAKSNVTMQMSHLTLSRGSGWRSSKHKDRRTSTKALPAATAVDAPEEVDIIPKYSGGFMSHGFRHFPIEILEKIFNFLDQPLSPSILLVCKTWYYVARKFIYACPRLDVHNYQKFVETISSGEELGPLVKILDLTSIVHQGKNSFTARLLRRCSKNLEAFIAPQTSFGYAPLISLKHCRKLKTLDLGLVSETVDLRELFLAIENATQLERLEFPRSSMNCLHYDNLWPPTIWYLCLSGGISSQFLISSTFPSTITHLTLTHCPFVSSDAVLSLLFRLGNHLTHLKVWYPLPALRSNALDSVLKLCPKLVSLEVSVDYLTRHVFDEINLPDTLPHPLKYLTLESSGMLGQAKKIQGDDISLAVLESKIPFLKNVRVSHKLGWSPSQMELEELAEILEDNGGGVWML